MYFPNLASVQKIAKEMKGNKPPYTGVVPEDENQLDEARRQLGEYFRSAWGDEVMAMEVELGVSKEDYNEKMSQGALIRMVGGGRYDANGNRIFDK